MRVRLQLAALPMHVVQRGISRTTGGVESMMWVPVMRLPDGGTVEAVLPSSATVTAADLVCGYRIHRIDGEIVEFVTLPALATHLRDQFDQSTYDALVDDIRSFARADCAAPSTSDEARGDLTVHRIDQCRPS